MNLNHNKIVEDFYIGEAHIKIRDDYCVNEEEADIVIARIEKIISKIHSDNLNKEKIRQK